MFSKNQEYWQPVLLNLKTALAQDPYTNQEALTQELFDAYFQSKGDKFVKKPEEIAPVAGGSQPMSPLGSMVQNKSLANVANGAV